MKAIIVLMFLTFSAQTFSKSFAGKLVTNIQENSGVEAKFSLLTDRGSIYINLTNEKHIRALYKLSGHIMVIEGTPKIDNDIALDDFDFDFDRSTPFANSRAAGMRRFDFDEFPDPIGNFDGAIVELEQYAVAVNEKEIQGVITSQWVDSLNDEAIFIKDESAQDQRVILPQDFQDDFYAKFNNKKVKVIGSTVTINSEKKFIVKNITATE